MTDPKAEALARLWVFDGYDARDEEVAALKAECERLKGFHAGEITVLRSALATAQYLIESNCKSGSMVTRGLTQICSALAVSAGPAGEKP